MIVPHSFTENSGFLNTRVWRFLLKMSYIKVIDLGHVIQIYEMEKEPNHMDKVLRDSEDGFEAIIPYNFFDAEETKERNRKHSWEQFAESLTKEQRLEQRRDQTVRDAKNNLKRLALMNFTQEHLFVTLTYKENFDDVKESDKHFSRFIADMREELDQDFKYIAVREFQKRGAVHYHMMCDIDLKFKEKWETELYEVEFAKIWGHGFVDIARMNKHRSENSKYKDKPIDNVGAYLSKYFSKSAEDPRLKGHKIYLPSKGLLRPRILKNDDAIEFIKENVKAKKMVFTNCYESEYLGKITFKEYNLKR